MNRTFLRLSALGMLAAAMSAQQYKYPGLWLRVSDETAPPGGVAQVQISLTEPKPIIRTRLVLEFDAGVVEEILGVSAFSEEGVVAGTAIRQGDRLIVHAVSPDGTFGYGEEDYPILTVTARVRSDVSAGARFAFRVDPHSEFWQPGGGKWEIGGNEAGSVTIDGTLSIDDVIPGGGVIQPGQEVRILGRGFRPWSRVEIYEAPPLRVTYVSPYELIITAGEPYQLDQHRLRVINPDQTEKAYYPYVRGVRRWRSSFDPLAAAEPVFSRQTWTAAVLDLPAELAEPGRIAGAALLNPNLDPVTVRFDLYDETGSVIATAFRELAPLERLVKSVEEIFPGLPLGGHTALLIQAEIPVHVLGLASEGKEAGSALLPLLPQPLE
jgi:hypothetical protein